MNPLHGFRLLWLSKISQLEALHAIYEAPRYILLHRQNSRLGIFTASMTRAGLLHLPAGTRRFNSSNQLSTTLICVGDVSAESMDLSIRKRWPSGETS